MTMRKQQGITLIGFVMILAIVLFSAFIAMKLFPIYQEYFSVVTAMKGVAQEPNVQNKSPAEIRKMLFNRFYISYVESVERDDVSISKRNGYTVTIAYEVRKPLVGNLDIVAKFDKTVDLLTGNEI